MTMPQGNATQFCSPEPLVLIWLCLLYPVRFILEQMPVVQQMLGSWTALEASVWYSPASVVSVVLLYTSINRVPEAGSFLRFVWKSGRWLLAGAYAWTAVVLLALNVPVLIRVEHRHFNALLVLLSIDLVAAGYLLASASVRQFFSAFPSATELTEEETAAKAKLQERQQFIRDVRLAAPIAQNPEQERIEAHWRTEIQHDVHKALPWLELGILAYQCGRLDQALLFVKRALELEPESPLVLRNLCELLRQNGELSKAIDYGERAVSLAPKDELAHFNFAAVLSKNKDFERTIYHYHRAIDINPQHASSWFGLARVLIKVNRVYDAKMALDAVLLIEPNNIEACRIKNELSKNE